jgi:hypothetical protein
VTEIFLTWHAIQRYRERVADVPAAAIWLALDIPAIRIAIEFGARFVRLPGGQRVVLDKNHVITILPRDFCTRRLDLRRDPLFDDAEAPASSSEAVGD